jgi:hypothetical protein
LAEREAREMSQEFLKKLRDYLSERLKDEVLYGFRFKPFEIEMPSPFPGEKWLVGAPVEAQVATPIMSIAESVDGTLCVYSFGTDRAGVYIGECLVNKYRRKLREAKAKGKEEEEKAWKALREEEKKVREDYVNRKNIEKHLKKNYKEAFIRLLWFEEVAKRIPKEYGVEVEMKIANDIDCGSCLVSEFDGSNMSEEEKFEGIGKRVEAVMAAYKLARKAYEKRPWNEEYLKFRKALLEKYTSKSIKNPLIKNGNKIIL